MIIRIKCCIPLISLILLVLMPSCQEPENEIDSAHLVVMQIHDEVMPKQSAISAAQLTIKKWINAKDSSYAIPNEITSTLELLAQAEEAMWSWMNNYSKPKSDADHSIAMQYLKGQEESISKVRDQMLKSIETYDALNEKYNF